MGCFLLGAVVNSSAMNMGVRALNSFGYVLRGRIAGSHGSSMFNFLKNCYYYILNCYLQVPLLYSLDWKDHDENCKVFHITAGSQPLRPLVRVLQILERMWECHGGPADVR